MSAPCVIVDNGSFQLRAGYPGEGAPRVSIPSLVGVPRNKGVALAAGLREYEVGYGAVERRGQLDWCRPIRSGHVRDWGDMERLWSHVIYKELRITPEEFCFVLTQPTHATQHHKEAMLEMMMETFNAHSLYLGVAPVFCLYSYGLTTGVVIDSGLDDTAAVPIHEGYALGRQVASSSIAGDVLTRHLAKLLDEKGYGFSTHVELDLVNSVKETLCYVRQSPQDNAPPSECFHLPDGQPIPMDDERHATPEALFNFSIMGEEHVPCQKVYTDNGTVFAPSFAKGISWLAYAAVNSCEATLRPALYNSIVLAGGSTLFPGTQSRILREMRQMYKEMHPNEGMIPISVDEVECRQYSAWMGGSMLTMISEFPHLTVSRKEYEEHGHRIIHCKSL